MDTLVAAATAVAMLAIYFTNWHIEAASVLARGLVFAVLGSLLLTLAELGLRADDWGSALLVSGLLVLVHLPGFVAAVREHPETRLLPPAAPARSHPRAEAGPLGRRAESYPDRRLGVFRAGSTSRSTPRNLSPSAATVATTLERSARAQPRAPAKPREQ
jgi:hypothetical protein